MYTYLNHATIQCYEKISKFNYVIYINVLFIGVNPFYYFWIERNTIFLPHAFNWANCTICCLWRVIYEWMFTEFFPHLKILRLLFYRGYSSPIKLRESLDRWTDHHILPEHPQSTAKVNIPKCQYGWQSRRYELPFGVYPLRRENKRRKTGLGLEWRSYTMYKNINENSNL